MIEQRVNCTFDATGNAMQMATLRFHLLIILTAVAMVPAADECLASDWQQFRGRQGSGLSADDQPLPTDIAPDRHLLWKMPLAKGHSSPVISGQHLFVTCKRDKQLLTIAVNTKTGTVLWERESPYKRLERIHRVGSHATPSVATDGKYVVSMFGSSGLACYDFDGNEVWRRRLGPFDNQFGAASSPIIVNDRVVLVQDHDNGSYLTAIELKTGRDIWRTERTAFRRNYGSPAIWQVGKQTQIVLSGTSQVTAYDADDGSLIWMVQGISRVVNTTPVIGNDGRLYVAAAGGGSTREPEFKTLLATADANKNSQLEQRELPGSPIKSFFGQFDRDRNGSLSETEYESIRQVFASARDVVVCIRPGGSGDVTKTHIVWNYGKTVPRSSSPLFVENKLFLIKDGGILSCLDTQTGQVTKQGRLGARGKFYSSPVYGDGKLYILSERGQLSVIDANANWREIATANFEEDVYATPAIAYGRVYVRTVGQLYCFGLKSK